MIVQNEHEEAVLLTYIAAEVLDEPDHELMHDLGRWAGLKGPPAQLQRQALAEMRRLWPEPAVGRFGNTSPYLLEVADKRGEKLFCRRGLTDIPEWFLEEVEHFGGIYQPLHVKAVGDGDELRVVAGRKRRGAVLELNQRRFLAWHDAWKAMRSAPILRAPLGKGWEVAPSRLIATVPVMHLSVGVDVCEEILVSENVSHYQATPVDLVFAAHRMKAEGWQIDDIAARLKTSAKTVDNFLALRSLVADGLDALQADTLGLTIAYKLAKLPAGKQRELLRQTAELRGAKRTAKIVELLGEAKPAAVRRPDPRQHERWRAVLAARPDPQSALTRGFFERLSARSKGAQPVVETPWADLNDRLGGGLQPGELVVLAGRPSMGKTAIAVNIGMHAAIPKFRDLDKEGRCARPLQPTLLFSLEMGQALVVDRIFAGEGSVEGDRIRRPMRRAGDGGWYGVLQEDDKSSLKAVAERVLGGAFYIDDRGGLTVAEIAAAIRRFRMEPQLFSSPEQVGLVIVDYVGLVRPMPGPKGRTREQEVAEISRVLKTVARDTNMAVVCVSQLNRQAEGRKDHRPMMSDLRETGALEQDADVIGLVFREEYYHTADTDQATRDRTRGLAELDICKQRNGPTGVVELLWRKAFTRFDAFDRRKE